MNERNQSVKADAGKPRISLVPTEIIRGVARAREIGVEKYGEIDNWKKVEPERYLDAVMRHLLAYIDGEIIDPDSGLNHLDHAACNIAFLMEMEKNRWA